jgi:hypothetical protein
MRSHFSPASIGVLLFALLALAGCSTSKEEQDFYERGWLWPRSMNTPDRPVTPREKEAAARGEEPTRW